MNNQKLLKELKIRDRSRLFRLSAIAIKNSFNCLNLKLFLNPARVYNLTCSCLQIEKMCKK